MKFLGMDLWSWAHWFTRWIHIYAAILWIGQTHLFGWLERVYHGQYPGLTEEKDGRSTVWTVHGGGFFVMEKIKEPEKLREHLHWFKFEALLTWVSGIALLVLLYYGGGLATGAPGPLLGEDYELTANMAAGLGLGSFVVAWFVYDAIMRTPLGDRGLQTAILFMPLVAGMSWLYCGIFNGRTAFIHMAGLLGTCMVGNVWLNIMPAHHQMVGALEKGEKPDMTVGDKAAHRSLHNSFMVVPVLLLMPSNHFFQLYGAGDSAWLILFGTFVFGLVEAKVVKRIA